MIATYFQGLYQDVYFNSHGKITAQIRNLFKRKSDEEAGVL